MSERNPPFDRMSANGCPKCGWTDGFHGWVRFAPGAFACMYLTPRHWGQHVHVSAQCQRCLFIDTEVERGSAASPLRFTAICAVVAGLAAGLLLSLGTPASIVVGVVWLIAFRAGIGCERRGNNHGERVGAC